MLYKFFSKVLANKLKIFLPYLVIENHSAFAKNHQITNNILAALETLHCMKKHDSRKNGFTDLKLDMSKAYDHVEWVFLEKLMKK